jgi:co-chaperonin GroES (HSP10)
MNTIVAVRKNIIFQFVEDVTAKRFVNSTASGIIISQQDGVQASVPRWGKVTHVGPEVVDVNVGDFVLIEAGKWTTGFYVNKERYWKTDEERVMAIGDEPTTTY